MMNHANYTSHTFAMIFHEFPHYESPSSFPKDYDKVVTDPVAVEGTSREAMLVREIEDLSVAAG